MESSYVLSITTFMYMTAAVLYAATWVFSFRRRTVGNIATALAVAGLAANTLGIALRWVESHDLGYGHAPFSNMYESCVLFSWTTVFLQLLFQRRFRVQSLGAVTLLLATLSLAYAALVTENEIAPLVPALQSNWLTAHVITCFLGYAAFAVGFGTSGLYLMKSAFGPVPAGGQPPAGGGFWAALPDLEVLDELTYQNIMFGFLFLTLGIITGSVWANSAWGRYWSWDPKETWSLVTWLVYATLIHVRLVRGWNGARIAWLSVAGFGAVLFTWFGVNLLLSGLHSYGG
jgi:cytochrome c-type biogenesis protein CcsB